MFIYGVLLLLDYYCTIVSRGYSIEHTIRSIINNLDELKLILAIIYYDSYTDASRTHEIKRQLKE